MWRRHRVLIGATLVGLAAIGVLPMASPSIVTLLALILAGIVGLKLIEG